MMMLILLALPAPGDIAEALPPTPTFDQRVDYFAWCARVTRGTHASDANAAALYAQVESELARIMAPDDPDDLDEPAWPAGMWTDSESDSDDRPHPWSPTKHPRWEKSYRLTRNVCQVIQQAAKRPYCEQPIEVAEGPRCIFAEEPPFTYRSRTYVKILSENAWREPIDSASFLLTLDTSLAIADQLDRVPTAIASIAASSLRNLVDLDVRSALHYELFDADTIKKALAILERHDAHEEGYNEYVAGELLGLFDLIQVAHDKAQPVVPNLAICGLEQAFRRVRQGAADPSRVARDLRRLFLELQELADRPYSPKLAREVDATADRMAEIFGAPIKPDFGEFAELLEELPDLGYAHSLRLFHYRAASRAATRVLLHVHLYKADNGEWPKTLEALPGELATKLVDPFANRAFRYRIVDGGPLLYSLGLNCKDDGGKQDPEMWDTQAGDLVYWPIRE